MACIRVWMELYEVCMSSIEQADRRAEGERRAAPDGTRKKAGPVVWAAEEGWLSRAAFPDSKILGQDAALARTLTDAYTPAGSAKSPTRTT
jgi:hypothetical protein